MDMFSDLPKPTPEELDESVTESLLKFETQFGSMAEAASGIEKPSEMLAALGLGFLVTAKTNPMFLVEFATVAAYKLIQQAREAEEEMDA